jgi:ribonuclease D
MHIHLFQYDLPDDFKASTAVAIDTEAMGLKNHRDRLCLVQVSNGDGHCYLVQFPKPDFSKSPNLKKILQDDSVQKIFHYARFDVAILMHSFQIDMANIYCTKIASRLCRTYTSRHGLKDLCKDLIQKEISKQEQTSDWGAESLSKEQQKYAATDVLYLHHLKQVLDVLLARENRNALAQECFKFLPSRARFDLLVSDSFDIFSYQCD